MAGAAKATIDHDTIRRWVEARGGHPAAVEGTGGDEDPGILRIDFPGYAGAESLRPISWDEWFEAFDQNELAFLHQDTIQGQTSRFNKLVSRESVALSAVEDEEEQAPSARAPAQPAPSRAPAREAQPSARAEPARRGIDLNKADVEELEQIEGVGRERAEHIVEYREQHGPFARVEDVDQVPGFDGALVAKVAEQARVGRKR